jgi:hypothetical protein
MMEVGMSRESELVGFAATVLFTAPTRKSIAARSPLECEPGYGGTADVEVNEGPGDR